MNNPEDASISTIRFLSAAQVARHLGVSKSTLRRLVLGAKFPAPRRLSAHRVAWPLWVVEEWARKEDANVR